MRLQFEPFYEEYLKKLAAYNLASATMYTDQWTVAPSAGIPHANEMMAILAQELFQIENDPAMIEKIEAYHKTLPEGSLEQKEVKMRLDDLGHTRNVPADVYRDFVKARNDAGYYWHQAKEKNDYALFKPYLVDLMNKSIEYMKYSPKYTGDNLYDVFLDAYEPGMNEEKYDAFFDVVKTELVPFIAKLRAEGRTIDDSMLSKSFDIERQERFMDTIMRYLRVDPTRVSLGTTEHPFTNFLSHNDMRITTHYYPDRFLSAILSTVHEYGHALYGLQMDEMFEGTKLNENVGSAAHESQSRFLENHIGRSKAFWQANYDELVKQFPEFEAVGLDALVDMINVSEPGLIRTEADELTYPLHILIRYELEKDMAEGKMDYDQLPTLWADKYEQYLGVRPQTDSEGVLQDVHWSDGYLGYFPTYALGSAYAAQLYHTMAKQIDVDKALREGRMEEITNWLKDNVHHYAGSKTMAEIVEIVSGEPFDPHYYVDYLKDKYSKLYGLK
ncbi:carboxypeptidase M32 [Dubosiella muris]|mgnify:FL=1|uniref:Carboxypeptidase M32 n=2 Tax=Dubosiella TaxID=1937008 RepID=A0AC61RBQ0_9FIRM|nr:carboxypeptidase M32 [Dubosiella muris]TGY67357.1 carboxypeptidase M32 [Dubosiella muris]